MDWFLAILALGFLIIVHEAGHYVVARLCGMHVERFSIGFGPAIKGLKWRSRSGTQFQLAPIPFGGFVEIRGMNIVEEVDPDDKTAYPNRPAWQRFLTIFAGPATNYLSAILLVFGLYTCHGVRSAERWYGVVDVMPGYDAAGKLEPGDRILALDGKELLANGPGPGLSEQVAAKQGAPVTLTVRRDGEVLDVTITPKPYVHWLDGDEDTPSYLLGITRNIQHDVVDIGVLDAAKRAVVYPVDQTERIAKGLYGIVKGTEEADPGGPKRIVEEFKSAFEYSLVAGIELLAVLSVYLGLFNLFPLPALDGGRLVFLIYEMVTRRRANPKIEAMVHMGGIMVLGVVMILVTLRDFHLI